jgi:hypothetical protein
VTVDAEGGVQQHAGEVGGRTAAARAVLHLRLVRLGMGGKLPQRLRRQVLARDQEKRHFRVQPDRREIGRRIVERILVERLARRMGPDVAEHELIAVGRGFRHAGGPGHPAGAADILHHHLLPQELAHAQREDASERIHRPAGGERHHHGDGPARPILRLSLRCRGDERCQRGNHPESRHCNLFRSAAHSGLMPACFTTSRQHACSARMNVR